jgi:hypothetical protein
MQQKDINNKYHFTNLESVSPGSADSKHFNIYAIVLDASSPYPLEKKPKSMCTLKIVDQSYNENAIMLSIFSKDSALLPRVHAPCIIRIHGAFSGKYKGQTQINCELPKSNWAIFDIAFKTLATEFTPIGTSGNTLMEEAENEIITKLRAFAAKYLIEGKSVLEKKLTLLKDAKAQAKDFDSIAMVIGFRQVGDEYILKICDNTMLVKAHLYKELGASLKLCMGDIVKLRGFLMKEDGALHSSVFSNVIVIPAETPLNKKFKEEIIKAPKEVISQLYLHSMLPPPSKITTVKPEFESLPLGALSSLDSGKGPLHLSLNVVDMFPSDVSEWVVRYNKKTKEILPTGSLKENERYAYCVQFIISDEANEARRVVLFTGEDAGAELLPTACNLKAKENVAILKKLKQIKKLLMLGMINVGVIAHPMKEGHMWLIAGTQITI